MTNPNILTMRFATEFQCSGSECPDNCCHDWRIAVDKASYDDLKQLLPTLPGGEELLREGLMLNEPPDTTNYAILQNDDNGVCRFLDGEGLCRIHGELGPEHLGPTCKDYPRLVSNNFGQHELSLSISCPEAARLCLTTDNATELLETEASVIEGTSGSVLELPDGDNLPPYLQYRNEIRELFLALSRVKTFPVAARIFLMLHFANRVTGTFNRNSGEASIGAVVTEMEAIADPHSHQTLFQRFLDIEGDQAVSTGTVLGITLFRSEVGVSTLKHYLDDTLSHYGIDINGSSEDLNNEVLLPLVVRYLGNRTLIESNYMELLEEYLGRILEYSCFKQHYIQHDNLLDHVRALLINIQIIKLLFMLHPEVDAICQELGEGHTNPQQEESLTNAMIEAVYQASRGFDHWTSNGFKILAEALDQQGINNFEQLVQLSKS